LVSVVGFRWRLRVFLGALGADLERSQVESHLQGASRRPGGTKGGCMPILTIVLDAAGTPYETSMAFDADDNAQRALQAVLDAGRTSEAPYAVRIENERGECAEIRVSAIRGARIDAAPG
jgi:hypothetical protein